MHQINSWLPAAWNRVDDGLEAELHSSSPLLQLKHCVQFKFRQHEVEVGGEKR